MLTIAIFFVAFTTPGFAIPKPKFWRDIKPIYPEIDVPLHPGYQTPNERIVGGSIADPHDFPHQVALFLKKEGRTSFCGGSLISQRYVMTAAHCTYGATSIDVILGAYNIRDETEKDQILVTTGDYVIHHGYDLDELVNDISIIKLPEDVTLSDAIRAVNLPKWSDVGEDVTGKEGIVSGWGLIADSEVTYTDYLQYIQVPIISNDECDESFADGTIRATHVCTSGANGRSPCNGDSGGALIVNERQVGIVSFGTGPGCENGYPGVYTRITKFLNWIEDHSDVTIKA